MTAGHLTASRPAEGRPASPAGRGPPRFLVAVTDERIRRWDAVATLRWRSDLRNRWAAWLGLALLIAVLVGGIGAIAAGARRTDSAYPRFVRETRAPDLLVFNSLDPSFARLAPSALATLPRVREVGTIEGYDVVRPAAIGLFAPRDGVVGQRFWTRKLLAGRIPDASDPSGATISFTTAEHLHLHVGDDLPIVVQTRSGGTAETVEVHVDGIDAAVTEFPPRAGTDAATDGADTVCGPPRPSTPNTKTWRRTSDQPYSFNHGSQDVGSVQAEVTPTRPRPPDRIVRCGRTVGRHPAGHPPPSCRAVDPRHLLALAALLIVSQLLARQTVHGGHRLPRAARPRHDHTGRSGPSGWPEPP